MWRHRNSHSLLVGIQMVHSFWKIVWQFLTKLNTLLPYEYHKYQGAIALLGMYSKELKTYAHTKSCKWMFTAALFIIANTWKQPRCSSLGEWINKLWYRQTMEYYSALKRNEVPRHEKTWKNLKCIWLSERSQPEKATYMWFQLYGILKKAKLWRQ